VGWLIAPPPLSAGIRKVHDFLTVGAAHPLQVAVAQALAFPESYYDALLEDYRGRRDAIVRGLRETGFEPLTPDGAYYVMAGIEKLGWDDDVAFSRHLIETAAVATVPASSFYSDDPTRGRGQVRFSFPKKLETIERGIAALRRLGAAAT
jgi:aminotransferase